jgi:hypothetical protein
MRAGERASERASGRASPRVYKTRFWWFEWFVIKTPYEDLEPQGWFYGGSEAVPKEKKWQKDEKLSILTA